MKTVKIFSPFLFTIILIINLSSISLVSGQAHQSEKNTPSEAKQMLLEGNRRFVSGKTLHPRQDVERRKELSKEQHPFAIILGWRRFPHQP